MQTQPQLDHQPAVPDSDGEPRRDVRLPYVKPRIWMYTNEQLLAILGPARTGGMSDPFGPYAPGFDPATELWDEHPYFRTPASR